MYKVFVSYRREDTAFETTAIHEKLSDHLGAENVFIDIDSIPAGRDFREVIRSAVQNCDVLIAIIGDDWLNQTDEKGNRRLENPSDFVRLEIEAALERDVPVIPLLVGSAGMPKVDELPSPLQDLAYRHGLRVRAGRDFRNDINDLVENISATLEYKTPIAEADAQDSQVHPPSKAPEANVSEPPAKATKLATRTPFEARKTNISKPSVKAEERTIQLWVAFWTCYFGVSGLCLSAMFFITITAAISEIMK